MNFDEDVPTVKIKLDHLMEQDVVFDDYVSEGIELPNVKPSMLDVYLPIGGVVGLLLVYLLLWL